MTSKGRRARMADLRRRLALRTRASNLRAGVLARHVETFVAPDGLDPADVRLLVESSLFDDRWYAALSGLDLSREQAVRHYLAVGRHAGLSPHPLFDPETFRRARPRRVRDRDPLVAYLRTRSYFAATHPAFDTDDYIATTPQAGTYPGGPVAHYVEVGRARGLRPNRWYDGPDFLAWLNEQRDAWLAREDIALPAWTDTYDEAAAAAYVADRGAVRVPDGLIVSVVVLAGTDPDRVRASVDSVLAQSVQGLEVVVVRREETEEPGAELARLDPRVRVLDAAPSDIAALNRGLVEARGTYVAWVTAGDLWAPDRLRHLVDVLERSGAPLAQDIARDVSARDLDPPSREYATTPATAARLAAGLRPELSAVVTRRADTVAAGGFDETLPNAARHDLLLRLAEGLQEVPFVPVLGVTVDRFRRQADRTLRPGLRPWLDQADVDAWHDVVLSRRLIAWDQLAERTPQPGRTSIIMPTYKDATYTSRAVEKVHAAAAEHGDAVEVIVVANGCDLAVSSTLASLPDRFGGTRVLFNPVNHGFALGNDLGLLEATGEVVVFLNNDTEVKPDWLAPLQEALRDPDVLAAQSLLLFPTGSVQSAGIAFPVGGGVPHELLSGFPVEDAAGLEAESFQALTAAALAVRYDDVVALRGFDPVFRNGMEDSDFCLRLGRLRPGRLVVRPDSQVIHHESRTPGRFTSSTINRQVFLDRWADEIIGDDVALWRNRGYDVAGHRLKAKVPDRRLGQPMPLLVRRNRALFDVDEPAPVLRWAIKNPAPADETGEVWGDTHFSRRLAAGLREIGQEVVEDRRPEFERESGYLDDVVLVLRGLAPYRPAWGQINLAWLISHPEMFARAEGTLYDRVLAASMTWAEETSRRWGFRVDPLLQATDPAMFHPDVAAPDTGHPVLFVGGSRLQKRPLVMGAVERGLALGVYGHEWERLIPASYIQSTYLPYDQVPAAYRSAGVVLNDHWEDMRDLGFLSNRLFDAVAAGARVVTDDVAGLREVFGRNVQVATSADELAALVNAPDLDAVFGDDAYRREEAARIHRDHSFTARARTLLEAALEIRKNSSGRARS